MTEPAPNSPITRSWMWVGKLAPPQMQLESARREALLARLFGHRKAALVLITAPPGFGKTTLMAQWRTALQEDALKPQPVAWLSLDEVDRDPGRFFACLLLALEAGGLDLQGVSARAHAQTLDDNPEHTLAALLHALSADGRRYAVMLDDYHRASSPEIDAIVVKLLERASPWLHLTVATRTRPQWPLSSLKLRGLLHEVDASDLVLSLSESTQILAADTALDRAALSIIHVRTEGWAVAVQLARLWLMRGAGQVAGAQGLQGFSGRVSEMAEYLAEQIFGHLPPECREFLVETSLLERFDAPLADLVRGREDSAELLEKLLPYESLLVPLDAERHWFRYHHMLVDFLRPRVDTRRARDIHCAAARWLARQNDWAPAVTHALRGQDTALAISFVRESGVWKLVVNRGVPYVRSLLQQFDDRTRRSEPELLIIQAYLDAKQGDGALSLELLRLAEAFFTDDTPLQTRRSAETVQALTLVYLDRLGEGGPWPVTGSVAIERFPDDPLAQGTHLCTGALAALGEGRLDHAREAARSANACMRAAASDIGEICALMHESQALLYAGDLPASGQRVAQALALAEAFFGTDSSLKALVGCLKAQQLYLHGQWVDAAAWLHASQETAETLDGWMDVLATTADISWRVALRVSGLQAAHAALANTRQVGRRRHLSGLLALADAWEVDLLVQSGDLAQARELAATLEPRLPMTPPAMGPQGMAWRFLTAGSLALARVHLAAGAAQAARTRLERAANCLDEAGLHLPAMRLRLPALVARRRAQEDGELPQAEIRAAIAPLIQRGLGGLLLEVGPAVLPWLRSLAPSLQVADPAALNLLIAQLHGWHSHPPRQQTQFGAKEEQVLALLVAGQANKAIARSLGISENTVKFHLKQIFQKLHVDNRGAAIGAALQQGIAPAAVASGAVARNQPFALR